MFRWMRIPGLTLCVLVIALTVVTCGGDDTPDPLEDAGPLIEVTPEGAELLSSRSLSGEGGLVEEGGVPTVVRTFVPEEGHRTGEIMAAFDRVAEDEGLEVDVRRDGHCTVKPADGGTIVFVWREDPSAGEARLRAVQVDAPHDREARCLAEAGPPA